MENKLVIRELREIASVPNGLDEKILLQIQENLAVEVMRLYKHDFIVLMRRQKQEQTPTLEAERERNEFFSGRLQAEYRNRTLGGNGFSLPFYVEVAENFYKLEIGRHLQTIRDYLAQGRMSMEVNHEISAYKLRSVDADMRDMAHRVADSLNAMNQSLDRLSRVNTKSAVVVADKLRKEMGDTVQKFSDDGFSQVLLAEALTLAEAKRRLADLEKEPIDFAVPVH